MKGDLIRMGLERDIKLREEQKKYEKYCEFCGHTMSFYAFEKDRKLCNYCGRFNYRNKRVEFEYKLKNVVSKHL